MLMRIEWDAQKSLQNERKHGISLEHAAELFVSGAEYLEIFDRNHSQSEDRFIAIGPTERGVLVVVWTDRDEEVVRIISARPASSQERTLYHSWMEKYL